LPVEHSTCDLPNILTSLDFTDKHAKHDQLFSHSYSVGLNSFPYRCHLCPQIFHTTFWLNSQLEDPFQTFF
jgi:hypothetical protein